MRNSLLIAAVLLILMTGWQATMSGGRAVITVDPNVNYQTIVGWEATAQSGQIASLLFSKYKDRLFDQAVNDLGINRIRVEIYSGVENPIDYFSQYLNGRMNRNEWKQHWHEIINDNDDPFVMNPYGYQFAALNHTIDTVVRPLKQRLEARGEKLYVNLNVVDFACCKERSNLRYQDAPQEYAELILAAFMHLRNKYGWVPDAVEVILEPDNAGWSGIQIGRLIVSTGERLNANGFNPGFIAPSNTNMANAIAWFDEMVQVPDVLRFLSEFSYHRYGGVSDANLKAIAGRAVQYKLNTSMLEHIKSGYEDLHDDLKKGRVSAWQQFALAFPTKDNGAQYYWIDNEKVNIGKETKLLRQYFKYIRAGAVRIGANTNNLDFDPLAFINVGGGYVVVVKARRAGLFVLDGLPRGTYAIAHTTESQYDIQGPQIALQATETLKVRIPQAGVSTIYSIVKE